MQRRKGAFGALRLMADLKDRIAALKPLARNNPAAMLALAELLEQDGQGQEALDLCRAAVAAAPGDARLAAQAKALISGTVPTWHFGIVRDEIRNAAYDTALRSAISPGARVLEIGTGSGLLAMMAARAGAAQVVTCEMVPAIAEQARGIVASNGYADRVRVVAKKSGALDVEADLGGPADILVSEIVSNDLLGEEVLSAHEHAMRHLLKPGAQVIPASGTVRVALAQSGREPRLSHLNDVSGFDLSGLAALARPVRHMSVGDDRLVLRSEAGDLFHFDFATAAYCRPAGAEVHLTAQDGLVDGIVQWIMLQMDAETRYENRPTPGAKSCWAVLFHPLAQPLETVAGQQVCVRGWHDRTRLFIWLDGTD
jgi:type II protein arginine methyltransferase